MEIDVVKYKRQLRDWYNKNTFDLATLDMVAMVIGYKQEETGSTCKTNTTYKEKNHEMQS